MGHLEQAPAGPGKVIWTPDRVGAETPGRGGEDTLLLEETDPGGENTLDSGGADAPDTGGAETLDPGGEDTGREGRRSQIGSASTTSRLYNLPTARLSERQ